MSPRAEEEAVAAWRMSAPRPGSRSSIAAASDNTGFKAGNVREFCETQGRDFDLMLPLDADSLMSGEAILRLVRIMQAHPKLGILQSLVVGAPSASALRADLPVRHAARHARLHDGIGLVDRRLRPVLGPQRARADRAVLRALPPAGPARRPPLGGHVLSHDQVEATLMRRAGYEVRVLPEENGSWEENPPTMFEFSTRDLRWCQGNMQYFKLLGSSRAFCR